MKNEKQIILISACLLGSKVRYDGQAKEYKNIRKLLDYYDIIPICPEVDGGLKIPRPKAEIVGNKVMNEKGKDVTSFFNDGAYKALQVAQFKNVAFVILKKDHLLAEVILFMMALFQEKRFQVKELLQNY